MASANAPSPALESGNRVALLLSASASLLADHRTIAMAGINNGPFYVVLGGDHPGIYSER